MLRAFTPILRIVPNQRDFVASGAFSIMPNMGFGQARSRRT
jgi:hypothetical protein